MDIVVEIFLEIYMELMFLVVPEKNVSKKHIRIAKIVAIIVVFGIFALAIWGAVLIADDHNMWGIVPIAIAAVLSIIQIVAGIVLFKRYH